jgi:hypothetical protein
MQQDIMAHEIVVYPLEDMESGEFVYTVPVHITSVSDVIPWLNEVAQQMQWIKMKPVVVNEEGHLVTKGVYSGYEEYYCFAVVWTVVSHDGSLFIRMTLDTHNEPLLEEVLDLQMVPPLLQTTGLSREVGRHAPPNRRYDDRP